MQDFFHESSYPKTLKIALGHFDLFRKFAEIFASQVAPPVFNDTGGKFVHLELRISPRIFEKNRSGPNGIRRGLEKLTQEKNLKSEIW